MPNLWGIYKSQRGFTLVEVAGSMVALLAISYVAFQVKDKISASSSQAVLTTSTQTLQDKMVRYLQDTTAWNNTVKRNGNMQCLDTNTSCAAFNGKNYFEVFDNAKNVADAKNIGVQGNGGTQYFTYSGASCDAAAFGAQGNNCVLKLETKWAPQCSGNCVNPQVKVTGDWSFVDKIHGVVFNPSKYNFVISVSAKSIAKAATDADACALLGGTYINSKCELQKVTVVQGAGGPAPASINSSTDTNVVTINNNTNTNTNVVTTNTTTSAPTDTNTVAQTNTITDTNTVIGTSTDTLACPIIQNAKACACIDGSQSQQVCVNGAWVCDTSACPQTQPPPKDTGTQKTTQPPAPVNCSYATVNSTARCHNQAGCNTSCTINDDLSSYASMANVPVSKITGVRTDFFHYSSGKYSPGVCSAGPDYVMVQQGQTAVRNLGGTSGGKLMQGTLSLNGSAISITSAAIGWGSTCGQGCVDKLVVEVEYGDVGCVSKFWPPATDTTGGTIYKSGGTGVIIDQNLNQLNEPMLQAY